MYETTKTRFFCSDRMCDVYYAYGVNKKRLFCFPAKGKSGRQTEKMGENHTKSGVYSL